MDKRVLYINSSFQKDMPLPTADGTIDSINIEGYANTTSPDRSNDIIPKTAWEKGLENYMKNPIILAYHDRDEPIGRMIEHRIDDRGLWIKARISAASEDVFNLIKDGVLTAFSVGFMIKDATYDAITDLFIIKDLELLEISVVSVPCNQDSIFSISKAFDSAEEYDSFKKQFLVADKTKEASVATEPVKLKKEKFMDPKEMETLLAKAAEDAATKAAQAVIDAQAKAQAEAAAAAEAEKALESKVSEIVAKTVSVGESGAEKLLAEVEKRLAEQTESQKSVLAGLEATIAEKAKELESITKSKMSFSEGTSKEEYADIEKAFLLSKITGKGLAGTKFGGQLVEKLGPHLPAQRWEDEVSTNLEAEVRRQLVVAPLFRSIQMQTNVMYLPLNPEAGDATWMANSAFGTSTSAGATQTHTLKEISLSAYKVATNEYLNFEEDEDSLIALLPIIKDAMVRRVARAVDKAYLLGAGAGSDPVKGVSIYDATSVVTPTNTGSASIANLRALRRDLGYWGLDQSGITYVVSQDVYYDLLDDTNFMTVDKAGPAATILTGQVGFIGGSPVLVSSLFPTKAGGANTATTNIGAIAVAPQNFLVGNQRGVRLDTQDLVETQRRVLVTSLRTGMTQLTTNNGVGVSTLRWS